MKNTIGLFLIFMVIGLNSVLGQDEQKIDKQFYREKLSSYSRMNNVGLTMKGIGGGSLIAGSVLIISLPESYWDTSYGTINGNQEKYDQQAVQGLIFLSVGVGLLASGLTLSHFAKKKARSYRNRLDNFSLGIVPVHGGQGLSLTYHF